MTAAYTPGGVRLWRSTENGGLAIAASPDGEAVFATGWTQVVDETTDYLTVAHDVATGDSPWAEVYDRGSMDGDEDTASQHDESYDVGVSPDGATVFVTGATEYVLGDTIHRDYGTIAYDAADGDIVWASFYDGGAGRDTARSLVVAPDGTAVYVTGFSASGSDDSAATTVAYDAANGDELWAQRYEGPAGHHDGGLSIAITPDGAAVYVTGGTGGTGSGTSDWDMVTVGYDTSDGSPLWDKRFAGAEGGYDFGRSVAVGPDGSTVVVLGHSLGESGRFDTTTIAYAAPTGKRLWVMRAAGPSSNFGLSGDVEVSPDGSSVYVASSRTADGANDFLTVSYSASGAVRWRSLYDGGGPDKPTGLVVSPKGTKVFVSGGGVTFAYAA
jgi:hypothetical protein